MYICANRLVVEPICALFSLFYKQTHGQILFSLSLSFSQCVLLALALILVCSMSTTTTNMCRLFFFLLFEIFTYVLVNEFNMEDDDQNEKISNHDTIAKTKVTVESVRKGTLFLSQSVLFKEKTNRIIKISLKD